MRISQYGALSEYYIDAKHLAYRLEYTSFHTYADQAP